MITHFIKNTDKILRVALYERVSTTDKGQDPEMQLREYAQRRDFNVVGEFIDHASGTTENRIQYKLMMEAAKTKNRCRLGLAV